MCYGAMQVLIGFGGNIFFPYRAPIFSLNPTTQFILTIPVTTWIRDSEI